MREWVEPRDVEVPEGLSAAIGGHPLVAKTLVRRGITNVEVARAFLDPDRYEPSPPTDLPNLTSAAERLERAIRDGQRVYVWGDFDVDGQTATTILVSTLTDLGAVTDYHIPVRETESHGVNLPVLKRLIGDGAQLIVTCDTGVTAHESIGYARERGVDVIVTDHHDLPPVLPEACAIVNPKMLPMEDALRELPGVGCAYKVAEALHSRAGRPGDAARYLDLVALGIVADVAVQTGDTRYLLQQGLRALRQTERLGLQVMMKVAELDPEGLTEEHVGFILAPRLNALGRLADANVAVELLTTRDLARARILATEMEGLNARRKLLTDQVFQATEAQIERDRSLLDEGALVLSHPSWPAGVIGIVAGRLAERYGRPTVLIAAPPGELARGSARSVEGCDISAAIGAHRQMLISYGGHPMAAGLAIRAERIPEFRRALSQTVRGILEEAVGKAAVQISGYMSLAELSLSLVEELERLAPFGPGNPPLTLATRGLSLQSHSPAGRNGEHLQLIVEDEEGTAQKVIWWQWPGLPLPEGRFDLAYVARAADYRGQREVQVEWVDVRPAEVPAVSLRREPPKIEVVDYRGVPNPREVLDHLRTKEDVQIWGEAGARADVDARDRHELGRSKVLVIWTTPPGPKELEAVMENVSPERVYLFGVEPRLDRPEEFLKRLAGLAGYALESADGRASTSRLAAATAQREATVSAGIAWLAARGQVVIYDREGDELHLGIGAKASTSGLLEAENQLKALLEETAAYRAHFARADKETLIRSRGLPTAS